MFELELMKSQLSNVNKRGLRRQCGILEDSDFGITSKKEIKEMAEFVKNNNKRNNNNNRNNTPRQNNAFKKPVRARGIDVPEYAKEVIEYKMSAGMAAEILKADRTKRAPQEVLCEYVNSQCGLKGFCVRVSYF